MAIPDFLGARKTLGIRISSGKNPAGIFQLVQELPEHSRVTKIPLGAAGVPIPPTSGVRGNPGMFSIWEQGGKWGIPKEFLDVARDSSGIGWEFALRVLNKEIL